MPKSPLWFLNRLCVLVSSGQSKVFHMMSSIFYNYKMYIWDVLIYSYKMFPSPCFTLITQKIELLRELYSMGIWSSFKMETQNQGDFNGISFWK